MVRAALEQRLKRLEESTQADDGKVTRIELVNVATGEVGAVIHVGKKPDTAGVMQALKYKHETDPPRRLKSRE